MTESTRIGLAKAAVTALAILYAVAALAALATSTTNGGRSTADRIGSASAFGSNPLVR